MLTSARGNATAVRDASLLVSTFLRRYRKSSSANMVPPGNKISSMR
jgi:hypothetical protein